MNRGGGPVMRLESVGYAYRGGPAVLEGVSQAVHAGTFLALLGPNASGKTTLLKVMAGLLKPGSGRVELDGKPMDQVGLVERAGLLSYVPGGSVMTFTFTVGHVVAMGRYALPWRERDFRAIVSACQLEDLLDRPYVELSAGQQQRVLLARGLYQSAGQGRLMLLDEPTSAMDLEHVHQAMALLRQRTREGMAVVAVLHDLNLAAEYADQVWLLEGGRLVAAGSWETVLVPQTLEAVYRIAVRRVEGTEFGRVRPVFLAELSGPGGRGYNKKNHED